MISNLVYQLGFSSFNFPFAASLSVAGACACLCRARAAALGDAAARSDQLRTDAGPVTRFVLAWDRGRSRSRSVSCCCRPLVVAIAAFNARAMLAFPPDASVMALVRSRRWRTRISAPGFTTASSSRAWRRRSRSSSARASPSRSTVILSASSGRSKACCSRRSSSRISRSGSAFSSWPRNSAATRGYARRHCLPCGPGAAVRVAQRLHLAAQSRSALRARRGKPRRAAASGADDRHDPAAGAGSRQRLAVRRDPVVQRVHRVAVRDVPAHANLAGGHVQLRPRICRSVDGGAFRHVHRRDGGAADRSPTPFSASAKF